MSTTVRRYPTGDGTTSGSWTGGYAEVDDAVTDYTDSSGDTDYMASPEAASSSKLLTFTAFALPSNATNITVRVGYRARDITSGTNAIKGAMNNGGGLREVSGSGNNPSTSFVGYLDEFAVNPYTAASWAYNEVNGITEFGVRVSDSAPAMRVSICYIEAVYDLLAGWMGFGTFTGGLQNPFGCDMTGGLS